MVNTEGKWKQNTAPNPRTPSKTDATPLVQPCPKCVGCVVRSEMCGRCFLGICVTLPDIVYEPDIVLTRPKTRKPGDHGLQTLKKLNCGQRPVQPSSSDAVEIVVRRHVMTLVVCAAENHAYSLQPSREGWRLPRVGPLMNLVGWQSRQGEGQQHDIPP